LANLGGRLPALKPEHLAALPDIVRARAGQFATDC